MKSKVKSISIQILKVAFALGLMGYLISTGKIDLQRISQALFHSPWMLAAWSMGFITLMITAYRWYLLLKTQQIQITFKKTVQLVFVGHFFNIVIPGTVSGDLVKAYYVVKNESNKVAAGLSIFMDRFIGLIVLMVITVVAVLMNYAFIQTISELKMLTNMVLVVFGVFMLCAFCFALKKEMNLSEKWPNFFRQLTQAFWSYKSHPKTLSVAAVLTVINFSINLFMYYAAIQALGGLDLPFLKYFYLIPLGMFAMSVPIAPVGLGIGQGVFLVLFQWVHGSKITIGADMITLVQMVLVSWALVGCVVYLFHRDEVSLKAVENEVLSG